MSAVEFSISKGSTPGGTRIRGREMVAVVANGASTAFNVMTTVLYPTTFQRLVAFNGVFEEFFFHRANIIYQPSSGTQMSGAVSLWVDYDALDAAETAQVTAARNISYSISNVYAVNACQMLGSLCRLKRYLTSSATGVTALQIQQAQIRVATEGIPAPFTSPVGYLFIWYDVEFYAPN